MNIHITWQVDEVEEIDETQIRAAGRAALIHQNAPENAEITIVITGDEELHRLNKQFLGIDSPTDVLSFPSDEPDPDTGAQYLGDILISLPRSSIQAVDRGHSLEAEITLLTIHGVLHLMGHDHAEEGEKIAMWAGQEEIIKILAVNVNLP